jgi:hypothetical protein
MANVQSKLIGGRKFTAPATSGICKLSELSQDESYLVVSKDNNPTRFGSYVVTVINEYTDEEYRVYMPEYIAKHATADRVFCYNGLQKKTDGSGHAFHSVLWEQ